MKPKVETIEYMGEWTTRLTVGVQSFHLCLHGRTQSEAKFFSRALRHALKAIPIEASLRNGIPDHITFMGHKYRRVQRRKQ